MSANRATSSTTSRGRRIPSAAIVRPIRTDESRPILDTDEQAEAFVVGMIAIAEEVEQAENELWATVERLARAGNAAGILEIATKRRTSPPCEVARALTAPPPRAA